MPRVVPFSEAGFGFSAERISSTDGSAAAAPQKTSVSADATAIAYMPCLAIVKVPKNVSQGRRNQELKSFLRLFFKKEELLSWTKHLLTGVF
jgi:hypothetical protein